MIKRILRIPARIRQDFKIIKISKNWKEILASKINGKPLTVVKLRNGVVISAPEQIDLNFVFHEVWVDEIYLPEGYEINPSTVVIDIGANIGSFSLYASTKALNVKVYSFEPFPSNADYFEKNMKKSNAGNIVFFRGAVAGRTEKRKLNVSDSWIKHELNESNDVGGYNVVVESISLDDIFSRIDICDLLKIDCEGSEYEIFYSAKPDTLKKINRIVGEFHNREGKENTGKALSSFLEKNGFSIDKYYDFDEESGFFAAKRG